MLTILPAAWRFMTGTTAWQKRNVPVRLKCKSCCQSGSVSSSIGAAGLPMIVLPPTALTRMSMRLCSCTVRRTTLSTCAASSASAASACAAPPRARMAPVVSSSAALSVSTRTTVPPSRPMISAVARPMVEMIESVGGQAIAVEVDVTRSADCAAMVRTAVERFGRLDLLDNNVGIGSRGSVVDLGEDEWRRVMQVNVETMFLVAKHAIPAMRRAGGGAIVNVSSISALRPRGLTAYTASKGAVIALTRAMAVDHGREGIRVNCVAPGPVYTPMVYAGGMTPAVREKRKKASVLQQEGTGWDIGHAVRFLLSDYARYITGHTLVVDGGTTLTAPERDSQ